MDLTQLTEPFAYDDLEWRIAHAGKGQNGIWAKCLCYVTSRAIMERLDRVCGPDNWQTEYREGAHMMAGIGIRTNAAKGEWVWKWDGAGLLRANDGLSQTDAGKGDFSNALKRVGVQWGIGRYLYLVPEAFAIISDNGRFRARLPKDKGGDQYRWDPPQLPDWALPSGEMDVAIKRLNELVVKATPLATNDEQVARAIRRAQYNIAQRDMERIQGAAAWLEDRLKAKAA